MRKVKRNRRNLKTIWKQLDTASGLLENALDSTILMDGMSTDMKDDADRIDITAITMLKNQIEVLLEQTPASK